MTRTVTTGMVAAMIAGLGHPVGLIASTPWALVSSDTLDVLVAERWAERRSGAVYLTPAGESILRRLGYVLFNMAVIDREVLDQTGQELPVLLIACPCCGENEISAEELVCPECCCETNVEAGSYFMFSEARGKVRRVTVRAVDLAAWTAARDARVDGAVCSAVPVDAELVGGAR